MIFFSFGLPSAFTTWCETILVELVRQKFGKVEFINANSLEDLATSVVKTGASNMVYCSWFPNNRLSKLIVESGIPFLFILDDPHSATAYLVTARNCDTLGAIRAIAESHAHLMRCFGGPGALRLTPKGPVVALRETMLQIARHFGLELAEAEFDTLHEILQRRIDDRFVPGNSGWWSSLSEALRAVADGAYLGYQKFFQSKTMGTLTWRRELFLIGDKDEPLNGPIDLTGHGRCLIRGPYIHVPPGLWLTHIVFGCSAEAAGVSLSLDVCAGAQLSQTRVQPHAGGIFKIDLRFDIEEAQEHAVDIRIFSERSCLEGLISLSHVTLIPEAESESRNPMLAAELGLETS